MILDIFTKIALAPKYIAYALCVSGYFWFPSLAKRGRKRKDNVSRYPNGDIKSEVVLTPERRRHGTVMLPDQAIADDAGRPSHPYRAIDAWTEIPGVTPEMRSAGADFQATFAVAQLNPLKASDPGRPLAGHAISEMGAMSARIESARNSIWGALLQVGGLAAPAGSCLWNVIGLERSLKEWALERSCGRRIPKAEARGILIGALGELEAYYESARR